MLPTGKIFVLLLLALIYLSACQRKVPPPPLVTTADFNRGEQLYDVNNDSAFYLFNKVATTSKDSLEIAMSFDYMAIIQFDAGDYFGSQESSLTALSYLNRQNKSDHYSLLSAYNLLGSSSLNLKNYDAAIAYYKEAMAFISDEDVRLIALNNQAVAYQRKQHYPQAVALFESILNKSKNDSIGYARVLSNLAKTRWQLNRSYNAGPDLKRALEIRLEKKDDWGLNASYAHLSDFYSTSQPDSALLYAHKMYATARRLNSVDDRLEALQKLIRLSPATSAQSYFATYQVLSDSIQTTRNAAKNQFALIRYEAEKNKADNLRLQKENAEQEIQLLIHQALIGGIMLLFLLCVLIGISWYRRRRQQITWRHSQEIKEQQLKTSQKVHDVVANGLYHLMTEIEHQNGMETGLLLDKIEVLYDKSRNISYEITDKQSQLQDFQRTLHQLLNSFSTDTRKVYVVGNEARLWDTISNQAKTELEHILQELMVNMKKHSQAKSVTVKFLRNSNLLIIIYTDDGIGFPDEFTMGNGLSNTGNRIQGLNGRIIFDHPSSRGVKIQVEFPIN